MRPQHLLLFVCVTLLASSCATDPKKGIVGKWIPTESSEVEYIAFGADGSLKARVRGLDQTLVGTYKFVEDQAIQTDIHKALHAAMDRPGGAQVVVPSWFIGGKATAKVSRSELRLSTQGDQNNDVWRRAD
jgi:hypothetical protein